VDQQAVEPRIEALRIAEGRQLPPCGDERRLQGVLGQLAVAEDAVGDRHQAVAGAPRQGRERALIAVDRRLDECHLHPRPSASRPGRGIDLYESPPAAGRSILVHHPPRPPTERAVARRGSLWP
jgi:hypothetical protein